MKNTISILLAVFFVYNIAYVQNSVGLISSLPDYAYPGYNLIYPHNQSKVYLLDNCGRIVHDWEGGEDQRPGNTAYILDNGDLLKAYRPSSSISDPIWAGGAGATVELRTWDNLLVWSYTMNDSFARLHHDIEPLPNGNVLMIAWELKTLDEAIQAGRSPDLISQGKLWPDKVVEYNPFIDSIVWEWKAWDHLIQEYDSSKDNYGLVSEHPELIDVNWDTHDGHPDWLHINAIDFNPILDQIALSVPYFNEVWIIDHSTTTLEAASHEGGLSGKGGDILFRWGNPAAFQKGDSSDQKLYFQHDIRWIKPEAGFGDPLFGKLSLFNNRLPSINSSSNTLKTVFDTLEWNYNVLEDSTFLPETFSEVFFHPNDDIRAYSNGLSSTQILPNGNVLSCSGRWGYTYELNPLDGDIIWEYITPLSGGISVAQGTDLVINDNTTFRLTRYDSLYQAFEGKDLSPKGFIELSPNSAFCGGIVNAIEMEYFDEIQIYPNPVHEYLFFKTNHLSNIDVLIYNSLGENVLSSGLNANQSLNVGHLLPGCYFLIVPTLNRRFKFIKS